MTTLTRRSFLARIATTTAGASLIARSEALFALEPGPEPHINFPTEPRGRVAIASWPFRAYIDTPSNPDRDNDLPGMDLADFPGYVISKFKVRNIEPYNWHFSSTDPKYLERFRTSLANADAKAVNIAVDGDESFYDSDADTRKRTVEFAKKWIDVAQSIGAPSVRVHSVRARNSDPNLQRMVESLKQVADYGAQKDVVFNLENDDRVSEDPFFLVKVIEAVNHRYLRALPDFANSMQTGDADFNYRAVAAMFGHAYSICHVKDGEVSENGKPFSIDLAKTFGILKSAQYRGYCSIEFDGQGDPHGPTAKLVDATVKLLA